MANTIHKMNAKNKHNKQKVKAENLSGLAGGSLVVAQQDFAMKYHKESVCDFSTLFSEIDMVNTQSPKEYNLMLKCDGYGTSGATGTFVDLGSSEYRFVNPTPYTLYIRAQRPLGFQDDHNSIGAWEPLGDTVVHRVKSNKTKVITVGNHSTSHMLPRQVSLGTKRFIHLMTFSVQREPMSDSGAEPSENSKRDEKGLVVQCLTKYTCMGGDIGLEKNQWRITKEKCMNYTHAGPLVPLRIDGLTGAAVKNSGNSVPVVGMQCTSGMISGYITCNFIGIGPDQKPVDIIRPDGLDEGTIYQLEHPSLANYWSGTFWGELTLGGFIKYSGGYWNMCQPTVGNDGKVTWNYVIGSATKTYTSDYIGGQKLMPVLENTLSLSTKYTKGVYAVKTVHITRADLQKLQLVGDWWEKFIDGLVVVVKVTKLVGEILGILGLVVAGPLGGIQSINMLSAMDASVEEKEGYTVV